MRSLPSGNLIKKFPFLGIQKNALLRKIDTYNNDSWFIDFPALYKKPIEICEQTGQSLPMFQRERFVFSRDWRNQIVEYVSKYGLKLRMLEPQDPDLVKAFLLRRYPPHMASEISAFDLHRFFHYGHGVILQDEQGEIQGTIFEVAYDTPEKTSYTIRLAVSETQGGRNLGWHLMMYSCLLSMEQGSRVKRGLIQMNNLQSLHINLNKVGWICDGFEREIPGLEGPFFHIALPLNPAGLTENIIEFEKVRQFILTHHADIDYKLLPVNDVDAVENMYRETDFKVVSLLKPGFAHESAVFLAVPGADLGI